MSSPSLRPLINTCQKCSTSPANHEPRSPANGVSKSRGLFASVSFLPSAPVLYLALAPFSAQPKYRKPRSSVFLCSQTLRKRLLSRLGNDFNYKLLTFASINSFDLSFLTIFVLLSHVNERYFVLFSILQDLHCFSLLKIGKFNFCG